MKIPLIKENPSDKGYITPEELFVENKEEFQSISKQLKEQNKLNEKRLALYNDLENVINELKKETNSKVEKIEKVLKVKDVILKEYKSNFKKIEGIIEEIKEYFNKELKRVEDKHVVKMDTQPKKIYGLSNVTAPSMIEKTITPGTIRYDKEADEYRLCKKSGWETLKL